MRELVNASRRELLQSVLRLLIVGGSGLARAWSRDAGVQGFLETFPAKPSARWQRRFRVHAAVVILGAAIFKRDDVGAACVSAELATTVDRTLIALQFASGSRPDRAHGLNRFGLMREAVVERSSRVLKSCFSGFMTSSPEKNVDQARGAFGATSGAIPCSVGAGSSIDGRTEMSLRHLTAPPTAHWEDAASLLNDLERGSDPAGTVETQPGGPYATFLYAIRRATLDAAARTRCQFCHNGKIHELTTEKAANVVVPGANKARLTRMTGAIFDPRGAKATTFNLWFDASDPSGIPARVEFHPRSFLRLTLEAEPASTQAGLPWLIQEESA